MYSKIEKKDHTSSPKLRDNKQVKSPRLRPVQSKQENKKKEKNATPTEIKKEEYHLSLLKKNKKNLFDFKYECRKRDTLTKEIFGMINQYSFDELGEGRNETIFIENKWNESKIWDWSNNKNLISYGILLKQTIKLDSNPIECSICGGDSTENFEAGCGHLFCLDCWRDYLRNKLKESESNTLIKTCCMKQGCQVRLISSDWNLIFEGGKEYEERQKNLKISFLQSKKKKYSDCPNPSCDKLIIKSGLRSDNINVVCSCGVQFCFSCHSSPHFPIACMDFTKWNEEVTQTVDKSFYPKCPQCGILTEKTSGCEHITCVVCKKEWCYKCSSDWDVYHECDRSNSNKYLNSEISKELVSNQNNENIAKFFMQQYQENYANLIKGDIKHFKTKEMIEKVIFYRQIIKFSYVFSHFNKVSHFFEVRREFVVSMIDNFSKQLFTSKDSFFLTFDFTPIEKSAFYLFEIIEGK